MLRLTQVGQLPLPLTLSRALNLTLLSALSALSRLRSAYYELALNLSTPLNKVQQSPYW
jgi:hypothetical protein